MKKIYVRQRVEVGSRLQIKKLFSAIDGKGVPYWKFYTPLSTMINGKLYVYEHLWCKVIGQTKYSEGDWVEVTKIIGYCPNYSRHKNGNVSIFRDLVVEVGEILEVENGTDNS